MTDGPNGPAEIVKDKYDRSIGLASAALANVQSFQDALSNSVYQPPQISVRWESLAAPNLPAIPDIPDLPGIDVTVPGGMPSGTLAGTMGSVDVDGFDVAPPAMNFPAAPTMTIGAAPALPGYSTPSSARPYSGALNQGCHSASMARPAQP